MYIYAGRIGVSESIFWYRARGWNTTLYTNIDFSPRYIDDASEVPEEVIEKCSNDLTCVYDSVVTNSTNLGLYTARVHGEVNDQAQVLGKCV